MALSSASVGDASAHDENVSSDVVFHTRTQNNGSRNERELFSPFNTSRYLELAHIFETSRPKYLHES